MTEFHPTLGAATRSSTTRPTTATPTRPTFDPRARSSTTTACTASPSLAKAHLADIGNAEPTTYSADARDVYEEGALIFPCVKVQQDYRDIEDVIRDVPGCGSACRSSGRGDYLALLGAARVGERELLELGDEVGLGRARGVRARRGSTTASGG